MGTSRLLYWPFSCLQLHACVRQWDKQQEAFHR